MEIPNHIALIPDGNRRWAEARKLKPWLGHQEGALRFNEVVEEAFRLGSNCVTFWAASVDNLTKRSKIEVDFLVQYAQEEFEKDALKKLLLENKIQYRVIGKWREILNNQSLSAAIDTLEQQTSEFNERQLTLLFGYDGQLEMLEAINATRDTNKIVTAQDLESKLWTGHLPPVDLVIRTGGEPHWSAGFMMWLTANSQFYFTEKLWPDFTAHELQQAYTDFTSRQRRFGK